MIEDDVIRGVRAAREEYARLHGYNIRAMVADLQAKDAVGDWPVVSRPARRPRHADLPNQALQPTGAAASVSESSKVAEAAPAAEL
jgi:hypothetical protein